MSDGEACPLPGSMGIHEYSGIDGACIFCGAIEPNESLDEDNSNDCV